MANFFDQFDGQEVPEQPHPAEPVTQAVSQQPQGNYFDQFDTEQPVTQPSSKPEGFWANVKDMVTGDSRMTPEMENLQSVSDAPELSEFNKDAAKVAWAQMMGNQQDQEIMLRNLGAEISYDAKGNAIVTMPEMVKQMGWLPKHHADKLAAEYGGVAEVDGDGNTVIKLPPRQYALNKPGLSPEDVASGAALAASYTPAGRAGGLVSAGLRAAGTDALIQGTTSYMGGTDIDPFQVGLSGVLGTGGKAFENIVGAAARAIKGKMSPEAAEAVKFADANDVPLMTTDIIEPKTAAGKAARTYTERIPFAGTGGARVAQEESRKNLIQTFSSEVGGISDDALYKSASKGQQQFIKAASDRYNRIFDAMGDSPVDISGTIKAIDDQIASLTRPGLSQDRSAVNVLKQYKEDITGATNDLRLARENRTNLRKRFMAAPDDVDRDTLEKSASAIYEAYTRDMKKAVADNLGADAARAMHRADRSWAKFNDMMSNTRVKKAIQSGRVSPEDVTKLIFSQKNSDRSQLYRLLDSNGRNNARGALVQNALDKATDASGNVSVANFINEIHRTRKQASTFFKGEDGKRLDGVIKYLNSTREATNAAASPINGQLVAAPVALLAGTASYLNPVTAKVMAVIGAAGLSARAYESKPVRNMLLRLANTPKGSTAYDRLISKISQSVTAVSQGEKGK
ncbi:injection protein [Morganella morganii subsp. sibonii]